MAPKKSTIVLNVEQFIRDVEQRPAIWNRNFHCNKAFLEQMWDELSTEHNLPKVVLKAKWKGLRDNFRVEYKRIPRSENGEFLVEPATFESKWIHYYALLFLTEHMRHRVPKNEQDQAFFFAQQSQDYEKTVVEPDLTNGLIRRMQDSDEDFDEDDVEEDEDEHVDANIPPAAHTQPVTNAVTGTIIKTENARNLFKNIEKEVQDLSKKTVDSSKSPSYINTNITTSNSNVSNTTSILSTTVSSVTSTTLSSSSSPSSYSSLSSSSSSATATAAAAVVSTSSPYQQTTPPIAHATATALVAATLATMNGNATLVQAPPPAILPNTLVLPSTCIAAAAQQKIRSVSPPPLYNKAHHPPPTVLMSKERADDFPLNASSCLHGSHEHLNFTQHSYSNGLITALKLKRPRLSEDSNYNGSSTMDTTTTIATTNAPLVPEDDDYHYLLSLHPYMKQLTAAQKLRIRTKIQKLIFKELYKEDLEESK
uniref:MADF domain-containing protein n=1 Tax=Glossina austeni TaxID=7395 RepID=A0A1A9UM12_GLOAU